MVNYIDLFSGAGGFSAGLSKCGFENLFAVEFNEDIAQTYQYNFPNHLLLIEDIRNITDARIEELVKGKNVDLIVGGPPCQGFSLAGMPGRTFIEDPRNALFKEYIRFIDTICPKMFVFENVAGIVHHRSGKTLEEIVEAFRNAGEGYDVCSTIVNMSEHGIPQERRRFFMVGWKKQLNLNFDFPEKEKTVVTVRDAIGDLPVLSSGESCPEIPNHNAMHHRSDMLKKMSFVKDGGDRNQIPEEYRPLSGDIRKYIRYASDKPSVCVTGDMRKIFHYEQNRALTARELARLQSFPDSFVFVGNSICIQQQIGNAVPPLYAEKLGRKIKEALDG